MRQGLPYADLLKWYGTHNLVGTDAMKRVTVNGKTDQLSTLILNLVHLTLACDEGKAEAGFLMYSDVYVGSHPNCDTIRSTMEATFKLNSKVCVFSNGMRTMSDEQNAHAIRSSKTYVNRQLMTSFAVDPMSHYH